MQENNFTSYALTTYEFMNKANEVGVAVSMDISTRLGIGPTSENSPPN
jgi:hypothetical protein